MANTKMQRGPATERVAENVKTIRRARDLQLEDVSKTLSSLGWPISVSTLSKIELGQRRVDVDDLIALAVALGVTPNRLLLPAEADTEAETAVTRELRLPSFDVWAWATGEQQLQRYEPDSKGSSLEDFRQENRPHDPKAADNTPVSQLLDWEEQGVFTPLMAGYRSAREAGIPHLTILSVLNIGRLTELVRKARRY